MKFHYFFLFKIYIILLISLSIEKEFNPIPQENGKLNAEYNHQQNEKNLFFIFLNFRHGARAPIFLINDTTDMLGGKWLIKSELTNLGKIQHYEIGLKNKKRYSDFISNDYDPKEILIYSTYFDRAILSAESQLLGLYDNITYPYFNYSDINNNDIININKIIPPINLFLVNEKNNIREKYVKTFKHHFDCIYLREQIYKNLNKSNEIINSIVNNFINEYYNILIKEFEYIDPIEIKTIKGFDHFCDVYISIYYSEKNKYILNKFTKNGKNITKIKEICDNYLFNHFMYIRNGGYATNNYLISISPIFKNILNWMEIRIEKNNNFASDNNEPKLVLFSGHDSTLFEIQHFLKEAFNIDFEYTIFGSTQLFEIRKYGDLFYVELYYNDRLKMNITYNEFKNRIEKIIISDKDIYKICYKKEKELKIINIIICLSSIIILLLIILFLIIRKINKEKKVDLNMTKVIQIV